MEISLFSGDTLKVRSVSGQLNIHCEGYNKGDLKIEGESKVHSLDDISFEQFMEKLEAEYLEDKYHKKEDWNKLKVQIIDFVILLQTCKTKGQVAELLKEVKEKGAELKEKEILDFLQKRKVIINEQHFDFGETYEAHLAEILFLERELEQKLGQGGQKG